MQVTSPLENMLRIVVGKQMKLLPNMQPNMMSKKHGGNHIEMYGINVFVWQLRAKRRPIGRELASYKHI